MDSQMEKPFACATCKKAFSHPLQLHKHVEASHRAKPTGTPQVPTILEEATPQVPTILEGIKNENGNSDLGQAPTFGFSLSNVERKDRHSCGYCEKTFTDQSSVKTHEMSHTGEKPFSCPHCPDKFTRGSSLKDHIMRHTGKSLLKQCSRENVPID